MTKGEARKARQAAHAERAAARLASGDTRNREARQTETAALAVRKVRRAHKRSPAPGSLAWAEARGGLIGGYEED